jgi:hypothetical protein
MVTSQQRSQHSFIEAPPALNSGAYCLHLETGFGAPLHNIHRSSVGGDSVGSSLIPCLLNLIRPTAIVRSVMSIHILPVNGEARRALSHVSKKVFKSVLSQPSVTDSNPSLSIVLVVGIIWVGCSLLNSHPRNVSWGLVPSVLKFPLSSNIPAEAAARAGEATGQTARADRHFVPAVTKAFPFTPSLLVGFYPANSDQSSVAYSRAIDKISSGLDISAVVPYERFSFLHGNFMFGVSEGRPSRVGPSRYGGTTNVLRNTIHA